MRKPRAIVCDDAPSIQEVLRQILEDMGFEVLTADTPVTCAFYREDAASCPRHNRCTDVFITDYNMPNMTGMELLRMQHDRGCKLTSKNKALISMIDDPALRNDAEALGCHFFHKTKIVAALLPWIKECEKRFDLSEPLASDLYLPAQNKSL